MQLVAIIKFSPLVIGVRALSELAGGRGAGGDFLARKIYAIRECVIVEIGIRTHPCTNSKTNSFTNYRVVGIFRVSLIFRGFWICQVSRKKREIGFQTLLLGITFRGFQVQYLKVTNWKPYGRFFFTVCNQFH